MKKRPSVSSKWKASLTLEAALSLPIFLFFLVSLISFLLLIPLQTDIQISMEETARNLGKKAYLAEHLTAKEADGKENGENAGVLSAGINSLTIRSDLLKGRLSETVDASRVRGGTGGFYVYHSGYDRKQGILDIVVNYTYSFPFLPEHIGSVRCVQRSYSHVWTGKRLRDCEGAKKEQEEKTVYITPSGSAYHLSVACPYLDLSVHAVSADRVSELRNQDGKIYYACPDCGNKGAAEGTVYITEYGVKWHKSLSCSGLKRTIEAVPLSKVQGRHLCSRCAQLFGGEGS